MIEFYFDFVSPYAYVASSLIESIGARCGRDVVWKPFRLGVAVTKVMGLRPVMETPLKSEYTLSDIARVARIYGTPLCEDLRTIDPLPAQRVFHALDHDDRARFAKSALQERWANGLDISRPEALESLLSGMGLKPELVRFALEAPDTKAAVRSATEAAIAKGVFGSPFFLIGQEKFWGVDRLGMMVDYLEAGCRYVAQPPLTGALQRWLR